MGKLQKWTLVWLTAAALTVPLAWGQAKHWGSGQTVSGTHVKSWSGGSGGASWANRYAYDPDALMPYRYGPSTMGAWLSNRFTPQGSTVRWVWGIQQTSMAPGRYKLTDLYVRCRFTSGSASKYTMAVTKRVGDFLQTYQDTAGGTMEYDVTSLADGQGDVNVYLSNLPGWTPVEFDVASGDDVHLWFGFHSTGSANQPQANTVGGIDDLGGAPSCMYYQRTTSDPTAPIEDQDLSSPGTTSAFMVMSVESANRILYQEGTSGAPWLPLADNSKVVTIPAGAADGTYYIIFHGITPGAGNILILDFGSTVYGDGTYSQGHRTQFSMTGNLGGADSIGSGSTTGSQNNVPLRGKVEQASEFDMAFMVRKDGGDLYADPFWVNRTEGMGSTRVKPMADGTPKTSTTVSVSGTTVTAAAGIFESGDVGRRLEFTATGGLYDITGYTSTTVVTVGSAPSETTPGADISVVNPTDFTIMRHRTRNANKRGEAGYTVANDLPSYITITDALSSAVITTVTVAYQPIIQLGDSNTNNWQALGYKLPGSFTHPRSYMWASMGGATADKPSTQITPGGQRFCHDSTGMGDICEMDHALFCWSSFGTNDIWQSTGVPTYQEISGGIFRSLGHCLRFGGQYSPNSDWLIMTTTSMTGTGAKQEALAIEVADGLSGIAQGARMAFYDLQPLADSDPSYMNPDGVHLTEAGAIAVSAAAAERYESGQSSR